jgi:hypothetical protein
MVEMDDSHAEHRLVDLMIALIILINYFLEQERLPFEFFIERWDKDVVKFSQYDILGGK